MNAIRIVNLRSLEDTGYIDLKPITILVGQNSSGKSTFLRAFPLLRQSFEERTTGPILWYGRYVDFGSFKDSINSNAKEKEISFGFKFELKPDIRRRHDQRRNGNKKKDIEIFITIQSSDSNTEGYVSNISLQIDKNRFQISLGLKGEVRNLIINDAKMPSHLPSRPSPAHLPMNSLIPVFKFEIKYLLRDIFMEVLEDIMESEPKSKTKQKYFLKFFNTMTDIEYERVDQLFTEFPNELFVENVLSIMDNLKEPLTDEQMEIIKISSQLSLLSSLLRELQNYISYFSRNSTYIAPVRATAERFYRPQNLSVDDVDFQGKNLAVFLRSLNQSELAKFNKWTEKHFNFSAKVRVSGGQLSIAIREGGIERNLADTGFGYSQILPVITHLWSLTISKPKSLVRRNIPTLFSIEQPELHLHPRLQAKVSDALVDAYKISKDENFRLQLLVETHSETIVNRLGHRVAKGDINPNDINVVIFNKDKPELPTKVSVGKFDKEGYLINWPYGFFEPDFEEEE
jgi:predicted ATPase